MKLLKLLIIALILCVSCSISDDTSELLNAETYLDESLKSANVDGTVTIKLFSRITAISDYSSPSILCNPYPRPFPTEGNLTGRITYLGRLNESESTFERISCSMDFSTGMPIFYTMAEGKAVGMSGDILYRETHTWASPYEGTITGYSLITGGTGKFKGATGMLEIVAGETTENQGASYEEEGTVTLIVNKNKFTK